MNLGRGQPRSDGRRYGRMARRRRLLRKTAVLKGTVQDLQGCREVCSVRGVRGCVGARTRRCSHRVKLCFRGDEKLQVISWSFVAPFTLLVRTDGADALCLQSHSLLENVSLTRRATSS